MPNPKSEESSKTLESYSEVVRNVLFLGLPQFAMLLFVQSAVFIDMLFYFHYTSKMQNIIKKYSAGDHKKQGGTDAQKKDRSVYGSKQHFRDRLSQEAKKYGQARTQCRTIPCIMGLFMGNTAF